MNLHSQMQTMLPSNFNKYLPTFTLIGIAIFLPQLSQFSLTLDDEIAAFRTGIHPSPEQRRYTWAAQGRWAAELVEPLLASNTASTYWPIVAYIVGLIISFSLIIGYYSERFVRSDSLAFIVAISHPSLLFISEYYSNVLLSAVGAPTAIFAARLVMKLKLDCWQSVGRYILGIFLAAFSIGIYQSYIFLFAIVLLAFRLQPHVYKSQIDRPTRSFFFRMAMSMRDVVIAYASYRVIDLILKKYVYALPLDDYTDNFLRIDQLFIDPLVVFLKSARHILGVMLGHGEIYGAPQFFFGFILILIVILAGTYPSEKITRKNTVRYNVLSSLSIILTPFILTPFCGGSLPVRTYVSYPYALGILTFFACRRAKRFVPLLSWIVAIALFQSMNLTGSIQSTVAVVRTRDQLLANDLYMTMTDIIPEFRRGKQYSLEVYGTHPYKLPYPSLNEVGISYFNWRYQSVERICAYLNVLGYGNFVPARSSDRSIELFNAMPVWPAAHSVVFKNDVVYIKLGLEPDFAHR